MYTLITGTTSGIGRIMNIASIASFEPGPFMTMYYASKAFVRSFSEGLHEELKDPRSNCNCNLPRTNQNKI